MLQGASRNSLSSDSPDIFSSGKAEEEGILESSMPTDDNVVRRKKGDEDGEMEFLEVPFRYVFHSQNFRYHALMGNHPRLLLDTSEL